MTINNCESPAMPSPWMKNNSACPAKLMEEQPQSSCKPSCMEQNRASELQHMSHAVQNSWLMAAFQNAHACFQMSIDTLLICQAEVSPPDAGW